MTAGERLPVTPRGPGRYDVQGATATYTVEIVGDVARCSCPDHQYRRRACKHLAAVWHYLQVTDVLEGDPSLGGLAEGG